MKPKPFCITESFARAILLGLEKPLHLSPSIELVAVMSEHDGRELWRFRVDPARPIQKRPSTPEYAAEALRLFGTLQMKAELQAFEQCIVEWLNRNPSSSPAGRCAWCGKAETPSARVLPFGAGEHREWLDAECWALSTETGRGRPGIEGNGHSP